MKYLGGSFQSGGYSKAYADQYDRIFGKKCGHQFEFRGHVYSCELKKHNGDDHRAKLIDGEKPTDWISWTTDGKASFIYETVTIK